MAVAGGYHIIADFAKILVFINIRYDNSGPDIIFLA